IHHYTIPVVGKGFAMRQPETQTRKGKSINPVLGQRKKMQHMLQALASPIAFQVIGQAQQGVGFQPHDTSLIHSWIRNKSQPLSSTAPHSLTPKPMPE
ncbi:hypothetical protein JOQ06_030132, partial [Pogonophryne albipinna]